MNIVDAHHHIWRQTDLPWLLGPSQPRIFGEYDAIKRDYPIAEYLDDIAGSNVEKSVYVQANWAPNWAPTRPPGCRRLRIAPAGRTPLSAIAT
jgi:predicted TIM-barrel fold metal-dependent hydrolase